MNKVLKSGMALAMLVTAMPASALATTSSPTQTTPVNATVAATPINVTVSDAITMTVATNTNTAVYSDLALNNLSAAGVIKITNISVTPAAGWNKVADTTDFKNLPMNAKQFSMVHETQDLKTDYAPNYEVNPETNKVLKFTGKTGAVTTPVKGEKVADVVLTVAYK